MKTKNILLTISLVAFAIGFSDLQENIVFWLGRPVGAIVIIAYYIMVLLEKEYATFDQAEGAKVKRLPEGKPGRSIDAKSGAQVLSVSGAR